MILMNGKKIAEEKLISLQKKLAEEGVSLSLAVVKIGADPVSEIYVNAKKKTLEQYGINVSVYSFDEKVTFEELEKTVPSLEEDGIIIQLPLLNDLERSEVLNLIPLEKDVDVLSESACGKFYSGTFNVDPPVVGAVKTLLEEHGITCKGKTVALVGSGSLVGKPLAVFFLKEEATVSVLNQHTKDISFFTKNADIIVSGTGVSDLVKAEMIKDGVVLIDAGTSTVSGKLKGDVDRESVKKERGLLSPVPGGVGPLTTYYIAKNLFKLKTRKNEY